MRKGKNSIKHWRVTNHNHMPEEFYEDLNDNRNYVKLYNDCYQYTGYLRKFKVKVLKPIPNMPEFEVDNIYLAADIWDKKVPHVKRLYLYNTKVEETNALFTHDIELKQFIQFYPDGVIPMKVKRKIHTHKEKK